LSKAYCSSVAYVFPLVVVIYCVGKYKYILGSIFSKRSHERRHELIGIYPYRIAAHIPAIFVKDVRGGVTRKEWVFLPVRVPGSISSCYNISISFSFKEDG